MNIIKLTTLAISLLFLPAAVHAVNLGDIVTKAGRGAGDNVAATDTNLSFPVSVTVDSSGNLYIADLSTNRIRKVDSSTGIITTVAGNGTLGFYGDNGAATSARLNFPRDVTVDSSGNLYIADGNNNRIRKVDSGTGIITTVAGNSTQGFSGDNGAATSASLKLPSGVTVDSSGNLYIADQYNNRIRKVAAGTGIITTVAGNGTQGFSGDNGAATSASLNLPRDVTVDSSGNLYIADQSNNRIRKVAAGTGIITTVAGNGNPYGDENGVATVASVSFPVSVTVDSSGNLYIASDNINRIRKVDSGTGIITTVAGSFNDGFSGDNGAATSASLNLPRDVTLDSSGNLYIADSSNHRIRMVAAETGIITTVAGNGTVAYAGDNGAATSASLNWPTGVTVDSSGNLFIADNNNNRIRKVASGTGIITTVAGNGTGTYAGDNGPATSASLNPSQVAIDSSGNLYITDSGNHRIRKVASGTGIITTVAGNGSPSVGDNSTATSTSLYLPADVTFDSSGNLYIADYYHHRIRKVVSGTDIITIVAGDGTQGFNGDNGTATSARLNLPTGVTVDSSGNLYITDSGNHRIRKVASGTGIITTVAGNGSQGFSGDNGPATSASLNSPSRVAIDSSGNLYIADTDNHRIRKVDSGTGIITTVAGNGWQGFSDNRAATSASLDSPRDVTVDNIGNLYIAESVNGCIRKVYLNRVPTVTALASTAVGNSSVSGSAVAFTATVTSTEDIPVNTILTFKDGAATIGSGVLDATGTATFTTSSLAPGSHNITVSFPVTGILAGSTSPVLVQTVITTPVISVLSMTMLGTGDGAVNSSPTGITCASGSSSGCVQAFPNGTPITLTATPNWKSSFTGWGTPCSGTDACLFTLHDDTGISATFSVVPRIKLPGPNYFASLQDAYEQANDGDTLNAVVYSFSENLQTDRSMTVTLRGGMSSDFLNQDAYTTLGGSLTVVQGTLIVDHLLVQ